MKIGRKIEEFIPYEGYEKVDIRFASNTSIFHAEFGGNDFDDSDINLLKDKIIKDAKAKMNTKWVPVIYIEVESDDWNKSIHGFSFSKRLLGTINYPDGTVKKVIAHWTNDMQKDDNEDTSTWKACYPQYDFTEPGEREKVIPYSKESYETLEFIERRMNELKAKIGQLINGSDCESFLGKVCASQDKFLKLEHK